MSGELKPGDPIHCRGCGTQRGIWPQNPVPDHCDQCPPWRCDQCGEMDSADKHCSCWQSLEGMSLADLKAVFAAADLGLENPS